MTFFILSLTMHLWQDDEENLQAAGFHMDTAAKGASAQGAGFQLKFWMMRVEEENAGPVWQQLSPYGSACETQAREHGPGFFLPLPRPRGGSLHRALGSVVRLGLNGVTCYQVFRVKVQRTARVREHEPGFLPLLRPRGGSLPRALGSVVRLGLNSVTCDKMFWVRVQRTAQVREHEPGFLPLPRPKGRSLLRALGSVVGLELNGVTCDKIFWVKVQRTPQVRECGVRLCASLALLAFC